MNALEDRIRAGLSADRAVPDLWEAVHKGARRRRVRRTAVAECGAALAVAVITTGVAISVGGERQSAPSPAPRPSRPERPNPGPGADEYPVTITAHGDDILVETVSECPKPWSRSPRDCTQGWWRFDGEAWSAVPSPQGRVGVPFGASGGRWLANGQDGVLWPAYGLPAMATRDGGQSWRKLDFPSECRDRDRHSCGLESTDTGVFVAIDGETIYRADPSLESWLPVETPDILGAGLPRIFFGANLLVAQDGSNNVTNLWLSRDDGRTWRTSPLPPLPCGNNVHLIVTDDGGGFVAGCRADGPPNELMGSVDLRTWHHLGTEPVVRDLYFTARFLSAEAVIVGDRGAQRLLTPTGPSPVTLPTGTWFWHGLRVGSTYYGKASAGGASGRSPGQIIRSDDGGRTWTALTPMVPAPR